MIEAWVLDHKSWVRRPLRVVGVLRYTPTATWVYVPAMKRRFMLHTTAFFTEHAAWCRWQGNMDHMRTYARRLKPEMREHMLSRIDGLCQVRVWSTEWYKRVEASHRVKGHITKEE